MTGARRQSPCWLKRVLQKVHNKRNPFSTVLENFSRPREGGISPWPGASASKIGSRRFAASSSVQAAIEESIPAGVLAAALFAVGGFHEERSR